MKRFLRHRSKRFGYDGWAVRVRGADSPLESTVSTTRQEARDIRSEMEPDLFERTEVIKVRISVEAAGW